MFHLSTSPTTPTSKSLFLSINRYRCRQTHHNQHDPDYTSLLCNQIISEHALSITRRPVPFCISESIRSFDSRECLNKQSWRCLPANTTMYKQCSVCKQPTQYTYIYYMILIYLTISENVGSKEDYLGILGDSQ